VGAVVGPTAVVVVLLSIVFGVPRVGGGLVEVGAQTVVVDRSVVVVVDGVVLTVVSGSLVVLVVVVVVVGDPSSKAIELAAWVAAISRRTSFAR
jgi:hypothetical protein